MRIEKWVTGLGFLGLLSSASASASAVPASWNAAAICNPQTATHAGRITYSDFGVYNTSTTADATVHCSAAPQVSPITGIAIILYDGSTSSDVNCSVRIQNGTGATIWSASATTTGSSSGPMARSWTPPANTIGMVYVSCTLPPKTPASSYLTSILVASD